MPSCFLPSGELDTIAERTSYAQLLAGIHRAANLFRSLGVGAQDAVALLAPNIPATHAALWGAQLAGRACPINYLLQPEHIAALLQASGAKLLVVLGPSPELDVWSTACKVLALHPLPLLVLRAPGGPVPAGIDFAAALREQPDTLQFTPVLAPDQVAACFHTGGTTGAPKLALHTQGNEAHTGWFAHAFYGFDEHTVEVNGFPLFHVAGTFVYGLALLAIGATQVLPTLTGMRNAAFARNYWRHCERHGVTAIACVPTILATLANSPVDADIARIRVAYTGGSPLPNELATQFEAHTGIPVRNILGMTECAGLLTIEPAAADRVPGSTGLRLPYTDVRVVPWRDGQAQLDARCATGETGVVVVRGPHVSPGYSDPARDAGMFEQGWLVSGDLGHADAQGFVHVTGRVQGRDHPRQPQHRSGPGRGSAARASGGGHGGRGRPNPTAMRAKCRWPSSPCGPASRSTRSCCWREVAPRVYERPAVPRRVTVLPALPMTAIGKLYKPALRLLAIETRLHEAFADWDVPVQVRADDRGGRLVAVLTLACPDSAERRRRVQQCLGAMSVRVELAFAA